MSVAASTVAPMTTQRTDRVDISLRIRVAFTNASTDRADQESGGTITVTSNGAIISGMLIPAWQYFAIHGADDIGPRDEDRRLAELFEKEESDLTEDEAAFIEAEQPQYLHLGWSHIFFGGLGGVLPRESDTNEPMTMRIRLSSVDGWTAHAFWPRADKDDSE